MECLANGALAGKTAWITGGGTGLGRAMALRFAALGARVGLSGRREQPLVETLDELRDDPYLARIEAMGEEIRAGRGEGLFEVEREDYALGRSGPERARMMRTLLSSLDLYNASGHGGERIDVLPRSFW